MPEPTVQVPVSLIERVDYLLGTDRDLTDRLGVQSELRALLAQQTPTAEPVTSICPRCGGSGCVGLADCRLCAGTGVVSNPDPFTIRDVTPPPAVPEV